MRYSVHGILRGTQRVLSSTSLTIVLLLLLSLVYLAVTIFPQGLSLDDYAKAGGKFLFFIKYFSLLNVFNTWYFLLTLFLLLLNLMLCTIARIKNSGGIIKVFSVVYHLLFLSIIITLLISWRVSVEDEVEVNEGGFKNIELKKGDVIGVRLKGFYVDYREVPEYINKKGLRNRLSIVIANEKSPEIINPERLRRAYREFTADVEVDYRGRKYKHLLRVNNSLTFSSYSLNLYSFEHLIELKINGKIYGVKSGEEFLVDGAKYKLSEVFTGNILHIDRSESLLKPEVTVYKRSGDSWSEAVILEKGVPVEIDGVKFEFIDYSQSVFFGVKYDPAVRVLKVLSFLSIFFMFSVIMGKIRGNII